MFGKRRIFVLLLATLCMSAAQIDVIFTTKGYKSLEQAAIGEPFLVEVRVSGAQQVDSLPVFANVLPKWITDMRKGSSIVTVNGKQTITHRFFYTFMIATAGTYSLGPVTVSADGSTYTVPVPRLQVSESERVVSKHTKPRVEWVVSKERMYENEQLSVTLRCSVPVDAAVTLENYKVASVPGLEITLEQPRKATLDGAGESVVDYEWHGTLVAEKAGTFTMPTATVWYSKQKNQHMLRSLFFGAKTRSIETPDKVLTVIPVPAYAKPVDAVGDFTELTSDGSCSFSPFCAQKIQVRLTGTGALHKAQPPRFVVPENLRLYTGACTVQPEGVTWEYAVQATQAGAYTLALEPYVVFNPTTEQFTELSAKAITCTVTGGEPQKTETTSEAPQPLPVPVVVIIAASIAGIGLFFWILSYLPFTAWGRRMMVRRSIKRQILRAVRKRDILSLYLIMRHLEQEGMLFVMPRLWRDVYDYCKYALFNPGKESEKDLDIFFKRVKRLVYEDGV